MSYYFEARKDWLKKELARLSKKAASLPDGTLVFYYNGAKAYHQTKNKEGKYIRKYIPFSKVEFARKLANKMRTYINNGFIPGDNLILTYETKDRPLDINYVQNLISFHFGV